MENPASNVVFPKELRLAKLLEQRLDKLGSCQALARAISAANGLVTSGRDRNESVDRRKLQRIISENESVTFSLGELRALDTYLARYGLSLDIVPLFSTPDLFRAISESNAVTCLLGSRPDADPRLTRVNLSHWDVMGQEQISRGVFNFGTNIRFDVFDVVVHKDLERARHSVTDGKWTELLGGEASIVCVGSTRASHASELVLCDLFRCDPFYEGPASRKQKVPFHFVWGENASDVLPSVFHYSADDIVPTDELAAKKVRVEGFNALAVGEQVYVDEVSLYGEGATYGVCVVKRRGKRIWLVLAGVTGPATYAASLALKHITVSLREDPQEDSPTYWMPFRAMVERDEEQEGGSLHKITDLEILEGLFQWPPV